MFLKIIGVITIPSIITAGIRFLLFGENISGNEVNLIIFIFLISFGFTCALFFPIED